MEKIFELAIIGAGVAGISSAVYAKRAGIDFLIFESTVLGGQLNLMSKVDNYIGISPDTDAVDFVNTLNQTISKLNITPIFEKVLAIEVTDGLVKLTTDASDYITKTLIVATGARPKKLAVEGEAEFIGRGVSYCAICDGYFFKNKVVAVVGGGNSAVEEALYLSKICEKVYLIHRREQLRALNYLKESLLKTANIEVIYNHVVTKIVGSDFVEGLILLNTKTNESKTINVNAVFIAIGVSPNTDIFKDLLELDEAGFIVTDENMKTSKDFIWAAGDCRKKTLRQLITAASDGAIAAIEAYKYLRTSYI